MTLNWLFLDLNSYFASVEQAEDPGLRGKPVAVVPTVADTTCCIAASYEAKAFGVKTGTMVREARKMCPGIIFLTGNHRKYVQYHNRIIDVVEKCIPVTKVMSIDEMVCQLIGREKIEQNARAIANHIKQSIYSEISPALTCSIGIAPNKYLAKVASDMQKPDGLTVIHPEDIPHVFYKLTPRDFPGIGHNMERRFIENKCLTVEKLYRLSIAEMRSIWGGIMGDEFWHLIRGENLEEKETKKRTIGHSHVLPPKLRNYNDALAICVKLLSKACMRLREDGYFAKEMTLGVKFMTKDIDDKYWFFKCKFHETQDTCFLCKELEAVWRNVPKNKKMLRVGITLSGLISQDKHQISLFEDYKSESLMRAWDKINKKYAKNLVYVASSQAVKDNFSARIAFQRIPKEYE